MKSSRSLMMRGEFFVQRPSNKSNTWLREIVYAASAWSHATKDKSFLGRYLDSPPPRTPPPLSLCRAHFPKAID